jgi:hypothetical protein
MLKNKILGKRFVIACLLVVTGLVGWMYGAKSSLSSENDSVLYYLHVKAVDELTEETLKFELEWSEEVFPNIKGSGPTIIEKHKDGSLSLAIVGRRLENGLGVRIVADGYRSRIVKVVPYYSGISGPVPDLTQAISLSKK